MGMKTAISIPDPIFRAAEELARRLGLSRSELYSRAVAALVQKHGDESVTQRLDAIYGSEDSSLDPVLARLQHASLKKHPGS